jgi:pimeloyl-ACP methyl ester carboxylesterase
MDGSIRAMPNDTASGEPNGGDVIVNSVRLRYLDWGGGGAPIVLLHATGFLGAIYRPIAQALTAIGHVYSFDQRGHGDSERPRGDIRSGWDVTASDLTQFILAMGFTNVRGIGHSAGATAIGAVASERPDLISRAMLVEPVISDPNEPAWRPGEMQARALKRRRTFDSVDAMFLSFKSKPPYDTWRKEILRDYCERGTYVEADGRRALKCHPEVEAGVYATAPDFDGLGRIMRCNAPLLVLFGERTDPPRLALAPRVAADHRRVVIVPGTTHFIPMEEPELTARMALDFLAQV